MVNGQLLLETLLWMIRGEIIKYSSYKRKCSEKENKQLEKEIKEIEEKFTNTNLVK